MTEYVTVSEYVTPSPHYPNGDSEGNGWTQVWGFMHSTGRRTCLGNHRTDDLPTIGTVCQV